MPGIVSIMVADCQWIAKCSDEGKFRQDKNTLFKSLSCQITADVCPVQPVEVGLKWFRGERPHNKDDFSLRMYQDEVQVQCTASWESVSSRQMTHSANNSPTPLISTIILCV